MGHVQIPSTALESLTHQRSLLLCRTTRANEHGYCLLRRICPVRLRERLEQFPTLQTRTGCLAELSQVRSTSVTPEFDSTQLPTREELRKYMC